MKLQGLIILVVAIFILTLPGMYLFNNGQGIKWDWADAAASDDTEDKDDPVVDILCLKGMKYLADDEYDKAIGAYSEAIKRDPKYSFSYIGRGNVYAAKGDLDRALSDYDRAARLDPQNEVAKELANLVREQQKKK